MPQDNSAYLKTLGRIEPGIAMIDADTYHASAAISLRRIANSLAFFRFLSYCIIIGYFLGKILVSVRGF